MNSDLEKIEKLRSELHYHNYLYYNLNKPVISDFEFDNRLKNLIELEKKVFRSATEKKLRKV